MYRYKKMLIEIKLLNLKHCGKTCLHQQFKEKFAGHNLRIFTADVGTQFKANYDQTTASKISSFIKFTAESRHNRSRGTNPCDNNIIIDTAYCNVVSFNKIFVVLNEVEEDLDKFII